MRNVLVSGGAGYIGSHTAKALWRAGFTPVVLDNLSEGHRWSVRWGPLVEGDLAQTDVVRNVLDDYQIQAVVHFAANAYVGESMQNPRKYFRNNVANTLNLLDAMLDCGVSRIVFSSSCATYGNPEHLPITEEHIQRPINPYGESKLFIERVLRWYGHSYSLRWVSLRYFNAAGADPDGELGEQHTPEPHIIPLVIQTALNLRPCFEIFGVDYPTADGTAVRDYIHVSDLAKAHVRALAYLSNGGDPTALNLGTGQGSSVREVIQTVERISGKRVVTRESPRRPGDPAVLVADASRAAAVLGWRPSQSTLERIVETAWRWHRARAERGESAAS